MLGNKRLVLLMIGLLMLAMIIIGYGYFLDLQFVGSNQTYVIDNWVLTDSTLKSVSSENDKSIPVVVFNNSGYLYNELLNAGIDKDIIDELAKRMNFSYTQQVMPRARIHSMMQAGLIDITVSLIERPERTRYSYFIPYFSQKNYALVRNSLDIKTEEELLEKTDVKVGIIRSYYYGPHYTTLIEKLREKRMIVETKDTENLYEMLKNGWIDVAFNIPESFLYYFDALNFEDIEVMDWAPDEVPQKRCLSLSKRYFTQEDVKIFEKVISEMKSDGTLHRIFTKYLPEDIAQRMCDF